MKAKHQVKLTTSSTTKDVRIKTQINTHKTATDLQNADLTKWRLEDLKEVAIELRLKGTGTKEELIKRLKPLQESKEL